MRDSALPSARMSIAARSSSRLSLKAPCTSYDDLGLRGVVALPFGSIVVTSSWFIFRILQGNPKKEFLWSLWVYTVPQRR